MIYKSTRIGQFGRPFTIYKFRTMVIGADKMGGPSTSADDPRLTKIGKFLRKTSLDELPQLVNVIKGEMSLIGPRPVTAKEIDDHYKEMAKHCFQVLPGITGLWQVSGRSNTSYDYRIALDSWYVRNWNLWLDIVILLKTVRVVLAGRGAR